MGHGTLHAEQIRGRRKLQAGKTKPDGPLRDIWYNIFLWDMLPLWCGTDKIKVVAGTLEDMVCVNSIPVGGGP